MSGVIDMKAFRDARTGPDADCRVSDEYGRPFGIFLIDFEHDGNTWSVEIPALDFADAEARLASLKGSAVLAGQLMARVPE